VVAEASGAVTVAAFLYHRNELPQTRINVAVISGGNVEPKMLAEIVEGQEPLIKSR
jgi:threonine dehydratase